MVAYIKVISSLATGESGVNRVFMQLVEGARKKFSTSNDDFKYISFDFILISLLRFCDILIERSGTPTLGVEIQEIHGFVAYLQLLG